MKKVVFILSFVFVAGLAFTTFANVTITDTDTKITIVEDSNDKKPCPKDCTAKCCAGEKSETAKKGETKCCSKAKKAECDKSAKAKECSKSEKTEKAEK